MEKIEITLPPTFLEHLAELRTRVYWSLLIFISLSTLGYFLHETLLFLLERPLNQPLFYTSPTGGFNFILKTSLFFGFIVSLPIFIYHILAFIRPALPYEARKYMVRFLLISCVFLLLGIFFAYYVSLPAALHFLGGFGDGHIQALITADEYFTFSTRYLAGFGILFQFPIILFLVNKITPLSSGRLLEYEKYVIFFSFLIAAIITPTPDVINQSIMAIPLIILYQITIVILWFTNRKDSRSSSVGQTKSNYKLNINQHKKQRLFVQKKK